MRFAWTITLGLLPFLAVAQNTAAQELPPFEEPEVSVFIAKEGRGRAQQGMALWGRYLFSLEDRGHVNIYDFRKAAPAPIAARERAQTAAAGSKDPAADFFCPAAERIPGAARCQRQLFPAKPGSFGRSVVGALRNLFRAASSQIRRAPQMAALPAHSPCIRRNPGSSGIFAPLSPEIPGLTVNPRHGIIF